MRYRVLLAAGMVLALVTLACGPCGMVGDLVGGDGPAIEVPEIDLPDMESEEEAEEAPEATTAPAEEEAEEEAPAEEGGGVGASLGVDIPVYPGATAMDEEFMPSMPGGGEEYDVAEAWSYETDDALDTVVDFYLAEMPKRGFEKTMGASLGEGHVSVWAHESEGVGVSMVIAEQEGGTVIAIIAGK